MKNKLLKLLKAVILLAVIAGVFFIVYTVTSSNALEIIGAVKFVGIAFASGVILFLAEKFGGDDD